MEGRPNRRNKAAFSNFFGVVWTECGRLAATFTFAVIT